MTGIEKTDMLLWMDVETTGLDPDHDRILEVELRCTDMKGVLCVGGFHRVIGLAERNVSITDENFKAWRMHCANGLLEDAFDAGYTEAATANGLEEYVDSLAQSFTLHPAGSNPQFDLDFIGRLCRNLPLHYHRIDMNLEDGKRQPFILITMLPINSTITLCTIALLAKVFGLELKKTR